LIVFFEYGEYPEVIHRENKGASPNDPLTSVGNLRNLVTHTDGK
jgi:hypothetical protein